MAKKTLKRGIFITFEGPERCGKSTHSRLIRDFLLKEGYDVLFTREPGGTKVGNKIRDILLHLNADISPLSEMLLFEASRAEHIRQVIAPAIKEKRVVISDRFNDATLVYQGYAGKIHLKDIKRVEDVSIKGLRPDLTIILDIDVEKGLDKIRFRKDRMESKGLLFHKKVRAGYLALARENKKRIRVVKTQDTIEDTFRRIKKEVMNVIERNTRTR